MGGTAAVIDIAAVRLIRPGDHIGSQCGKYFRRDPRGGSVGAIQHHRNAVKPGGGGGDEKFLIFLPRPPGIDDMADLLPHRPLKGRSLDQPFDLILQGVG